MRYTWCMNTITLSVKLRKAEKERLDRLSVRYGISPNVLSRYIIAEATRELMSIPEESFNEYENADEIQTAFSSALRAERSGELYSSLPRSSKE